MYLCHISQCYFLSFPFICVILRNDGTVTQFSTHNVAMDRCHSKVGFAQIGNGVEEWRQEWTSPLTIWTISVVEITNIPMGCILRMGQDSNRFCLVHALSLFTLECHSALERVWNILTPVGWTLGWWGSRMVVFYCCWWCMTEQAVQVRVWFLRCHHFAVDWWNSASLC